MDDAQSPSQEESYTESAPGVVSTPKPRRMGLGVLIFGTAALLVVGGVGAVLAHRFDIWPFDKKADQIADLAETLGTIHSATYDISLNIQSGPRKLGAKPFALSKPKENGGLPPSDPNTAPIAPIFFDQSTLLSYLPADLNVTIKARGTTQLKDDGAGALDAKFGLGADVQLSDFTLNIDIEFLKKDDLMYGIVKKFPGILFFDPAPIKNKWVQLSVDDAAGSYFLASTDIEDARKKQETALEQAKRVYAYAQESGALTFVPKQSPDGAMGPSINYYEATYAREKLPDYYKTISQELTIRYGSDSLVVFDQKTFDYLSGEAFTEHFNYFRENGTVGMWLDTKTGFPIQFQYTLRLVPPDSAVKLKDVQYVLTGTLKLTDINKPVTIDAPSEFITFDDAQMLLSGQTKEEYYYQKQLGNIKNLRQNLEVYKLYAHRYPDSLDKLTSTYGEAQKVNPDSRANQYEDSFNRMKIMSVIPKDPFTQKPYPYEKKGDDYALTYTIQQPPKVFEQESVYRDAYANLIVIKVVDGINTATSKSISVEGGSTDASSYEANPYIQPQISSLDTDGDKFIDADERACGTDVNKKDTDGDGYSDGQEVRDGFNPLGSGKMTLAQLQVCKL